MQISIPYLGKNRNTVHHERESRNALCPKRFSRPRDQTRPCDPRDTREVQPLHKNPGKENVSVRVDFLIENGSGSKWFILLFEALNEYLYSSI